MAMAAADARTVDQLLSVIHDGGQPKYLLFWGHQPPPAGGVGKGCLSQWWPAAFTVDGVSYPSAEHYMMAAKARLSGDVEAAGRILAAPHPGAAKALGRQVAGSMSSDGRSTASMWWSPGTWPSSVSTGSYGTSWPALAAESSSRLPRETGCGASGWPPMTSGPGRRNAGQG